MSKTVMLIYTPIGSKTQSNTLGKTNELLKHLNYRPESAIVNLTSVYPDRNAA